MTKRVSASHAKAHLTVLAAEVSNGGGPVVIERRGVPVALLVGVERLQQVEDDAAEAERRAQAQQEARKHLADLLAAAREDPEGKQLTEEERENDEAFERMVEDIYRMRRFSAMSSWLASLEKEWVDKGFEDFVEMVATKEFDAIAEGVLMDLLRKRQAESGRNP